MRLAALIFATVLAVSALPCLAQPGGVEMASGVGMSGLSAYRDGRWSVVRAELRNASGADAEALVLVKQPGEVGRQFGQRAWVPAGARRVVFAPVRPEGHDAEARSIDIESQLVRGEAGRETATPATPGLLVHFPEGIIIGLLDDGRSAAIRGAVDALTADLGRPSRATAISGTTLDAMDRPAAWDLLDVLVVGAVPDPGPAQLEAARRWLVDGGRVWLMLDRGGAAIGEALAGPDWGLAMLGTTQLTDVPAGGLGAEGEPRDGAVDMARAVWPGAEVLQTVGGYPAAMRRRVGAGELLVMTVAAEGWVDADGAAGPWLEGLKWLVEPGSSGAATDAGPAVTSPAVRAFGEAEVGYEVLGRWVVIAVLAGFVVALLGFGWWAARAGRPERFAWAGLGLAAVAAAALIGLGLLRQTEADETLAQTQVVRHLSGQPYAAVDTLVSLYRPPGADTDALLRGEGGLPLLEGLTAEAGVVRVVWSDRDTWAFEVLRPAVGSVQDIGLTRVAPVAEPRVVRLTPTASGVIAEPSGDASGGLSDPLLVTPRGRYAVSADADGRLLIPSGPSLPPGVFAGSGLLSDQQVRRAALLEGLLSGRDAVAEPMLLAWTGGLPERLALSDATQQRTAAVTFIPLAWQRPTPGTAVALPEALIPFDVSRKRRGGTIYDPINRTFVSNVTMKQVMWLRFQLPPALLPMDLTGARVGVDLDAPARTVRILTERNGSDVEAATVDSPLGRRTFELGPEQLPSIDEGGGVLIAVDVLDPLEPGGIPPGWTLRDVSLTVTGTIGARDEP